MGKEREDKSKWEEYWEEVFWLSAIFYFANQSISDKESSCQCRIGCKPTSEPEPSKEKPSLESLIATVAEMNTPELQLTLVEEECTEILKEICKLRRGKGKRENLVGEAIDVITTSLVFLKQMGYLSELIESDIRYKLNYAINQDNSLGKR